MRVKLCLPTLVVVALLLALPPAVAAASPGATTRAATGVTATTATLNGTVDPNKQDTTYHFDYGKTTAYGNYAFTVTPLRNAQYQVRAKTSPPATSPVVRVNVRIALTFHLSDSTPKRGTRVRFFGVAKPGHDGAVVLIQRRASNGKFRTVAKTVL